MRSFWLLLMFACAPKGGSVSPVVDPNFPAVPNPGSPAVWSPPAPEVLKLGDESPLYLHADAKLPLVSIRILIPTGSVDDPGKKWGVAGLTAAMAQEASGDLSSLERSAAFDRLAAKFSIDAGREWTTVSLEVHQDRLKEAIPLVADAILEPKFLKEDWDRVWTRHMTGLEQSLDDNAAVSAQIGPRLWFGDEHPYGHSVGGTLASVKSIDLDDVRKFHAANYHSGGAVYIAVGAVDAGTLIPMFNEAFAAWKAKSRSKREYPAPKATRGLWFVDSPGSSQTVIRAIMPGPHERQDYARTELARIVLGGSFTSRLNQKLREEKGYTYGARLGLSQWNHEAMIAATTSVRSDATAPALADLIAVIEGARDNGFTEAEVSRAKAQALTDLVDGAESRASLAGTYALAISQGLDPVSVAKVGEEMVGPDAAAMKAATGEWIDPSKAAILLVGDKATVLPALEAAGFTGWVALDNQGAP